MANDILSELQTLSKRISQTKDKIQTEEATKMSFIVPFFQILGYDVYNPLEFVPEFTADVGTKKDEKVDYAIMENDKPVILIEAKSCNEKLDKHDNQLLRYFSVTSAKFGILTNGIEYRFYTDLDEINKMDRKPFLVINMLDLKDNSVNELKKFNKDRFNIDEILTTAEELKYTNSIVLLISSLYSDPSDDFAKYILSNVFEGVKTQNVIDKFKPIVKKSFSLFVNELINDKIKTAFENNTEEQIASAIEETANEEKQVISKVLTTDEELQAFYIVKSILAESVGLEKIVYKDTESYFGILFDNNVRKWICRFKLSDNRKLLILPEGEKDTIKYTLENIDDIYKYKSELISSVTRFK